MVFIIYPNQKVTQTKKKMQVNNILEKSSILPNISQLISQDQTQATKLKNNQLVANTKENKKILE